MVLGQFGGGQVTAAGGEEEEGAVVVDEAVTEKTPRVRAKGTDETPKTGAAHLASPAFPTQHRAFGVLVLGFLHPAADPQPLADVSGFAERDLKREGKKYYRVWGRAGCGCCPMGGLGEVKGGGCCPKAPRGARCLSFPSFMAPWGCHKADPIHPISTPRPTRASVSLPLGSMGPYRIHRHCPIATATPKPPLCLSFPPLCPYGDTINHPLPTPRAPQAPRMPQFPPSAPRSAPCRRGRG